MSTPTAAASRKPPAGAGLLVLLKPYRGLIAALVILTIAGNGLNLLVPKIISHSIDAYTQQTFVLQTAVLQFFVVAFLVFALTYLQSQISQDIRTQSTVPIVSNSLFTSSAVVNSTIIVLVSVVFMTVLIFGMDYSFARFVLYLFE